MVARTSLGAILALVMLSGCDDERDHATDLGGGPGSSAVDLAATGNGFCDPQGGVAALGTPSYVSSGEAKIDLDGSAAAANDATGQSTTSMTIGGKPVDSTHYNGIVMSQQQMTASGVKLGDWAVIQNTATGKTAFGRVYDAGPAGGQNEISGAAANAVGIHYDSNSFTVGNPQISVSAYAGTSGIQSDCTQYANNS